MFCGPAVLFVRSATCKPFTKMASKDENKPSTKRFDVSKCLQQMPFTANLHSQVAALEHLNSPCGKVEVNALLVFHSESGGF